jgi:hypothetical protein
MIAISMIESREEQAPHTIGRCLCAALMFAIAGGLRHHAVIPMLELARRELANGTRPQLRVDMCLRL